jgi:hypothetical protein
MRKPIFVSVLAFALLVSLMTTTGCKKTEFEDAQWELLEGSGFYDSQTDTTILNLNGRISLTQSRITNEIMRAEIINWQYAFFVGEDPVMAFDQTTYPDHIGDAWVSVSGLEEDHLWIQIQTGLPIPGDVLKGATPDILQLGVIYRDDKGTTYTIVGQTDFEFTRQ